MISKSASAIAHPNIAFVKYWGNRDDSLRLPLNGSISMNLDKFHTITKIEFSETFPEDSLMLNGKTEYGEKLKRVSQFLDLLRQRSKNQIKAHVLSKNNFPTGAGIASSASAFAALSLAASQAIGIDLNENELSSLARMGSGSASRSIPGGFTEWFAGSSDADSYAVSIAAKDHWSLCDCIAIISKTHKPTGSSEGHQIASSSPLLEGRLKDVDKRLELCREAILKKDFELLAEISELESNLMHAVMMTSRPALMYWEAASLHIMKEIQNWRKTGLEVFYTLDAGPNVHAICSKSSKEIIQQRLNKIPDIENVICSEPGGKTRNCKYSQ